jgi:eukaryotic-like serine/threonine-protein kinase
MGTNPSYFQGFADSPKRPVEQVTWNEARAFCTALSTMTGHTFTLPSEAQWEYACRAESITHYCFGDDDSILRNYAWTNVNSGDHTNEVGKKTPNKWGLFDMHGNVLEWCLDSFHDSYTGAPDNGSAWDPETGDICHVDRGGGWQYLDDGYWSASRYCYYKNLGYSDLGFRIVETVQ